MKKNYFLNYLIVNLIFFLFANCKNRKTLMQSKELYKIQFFYDISKVDESVNYISIPVNWNKIKMQAVIPTSEFCEIMGCNDNLGVQIFENKLFNVLVSRKAINLDSIAFLKLSKYFISKKDAKLWKKLNVSNLHLKGEKESRSFCVSNIENALTPSYRDRCLIHSLVMNYYKVRLDDETGFLLCTLRTKSDVLLFK